MQRAYLQIKTAIMDRQDLLIGELEDRVAKQDENYLKQQQVI